MEEVFVSYEILMLAEQVEFNLRAEESINKANTIGGLHG